MTPMPHGNVASVRTSRQQQPKMVSSFLVGRFVALLLVLIVLLPPSVHSTTRDGNEENTDLDRLYRFDASLLGPDFLPLLDGFDAWISGDGAADTSSSSSPSIDGPGASHAAHYTSTNTARRFHDACYAPPNATFYDTLEATKKRIEHRHGDFMDEMREMHAVFARAFDDDVDDVDDREDGKTDDDSDYDPKNAGAYSSDQRWTWRPAAHYSSRGGHHRTEWRGYMQRILMSYMGPVRQQGRVSGTYWYPPGSVREWHTNRLDVVGRVVEDQKWRMYYVRTAVATDEAKEKQAEKEEDESTTTTHRLPGSGMHLMGGGPGLDSDVLRRAGAHPLPSQESHEYDSAASLWRLPDKDGHVTLFKLGATENEWMWHCIVSQDVHRFSLGFAFSDDEARYLLERAGVVSSRTAAGDAVSSDEL